MAGKKTSLRKDAEPSAQDGSTVLKTARRKPPNAGKGRVKGVPNRATANAREAIARFVDANADRLQSWLDEIKEKEGAKAAMACFTDLIEYHVPKLGRMEHTGKDGASLPIVLHIAGPE